MNRLVLISLITLSIFSCSRENGADSFERDLSQGSEGIELIPLYKTQLDLFEKFGVDSTDNAELVLTGLFNPNVALLKDCFGYSDTSYVAAQLEIFDSRMTEVRLAEAYFDSINFLRLLKDYEETFADESGQKASGKFYFSFFERRICNFCGCDLNTMQMDLLVPENQDLQFLNILIPHEINHNAFEIARNDSSMQETILYKAIDEGFANLVSQKLAGVSVEEAFGLSDSEYQWYTENESVIKEMVKPILFLTDEELWDPLSVKVPNSFMDGSPGNIGYYVGYRIVEEFLKKSENEEEWKNVYSIPVKQIYEESGW